MPINADIDTKDWTVGRSALI